jgi:hypothetical protein
MNKVDAILSLRPGAEWVLRGDVLEWMDSNQTEPTEAEIQAEIVRLQADYDAKQYQRNRQPEYPSLATFADAYYWAQKGDNTKMDEYVSSCDAVKAKYPKPE